MATILRIRLLSRTLLRVLNEIRILGALPARHSRIAIAAYKATTRSNVSTSSDKKNKYQIRQLLKKCRVLQNRFPFFSSKLA